MDKEQLENLEEGFYRDNTNNSLVYIQRSQNGRYVFLKSPGCSPKEGLSGLVLYDSLYGDLEGVNDNGRKIDLTKVNPFEYLRSFVDRTTRFIEDFQGLAKFAQSQPKSTEEYSPESRGRRFWEETKEILVCMGLTAYLCPYIIPSFKKANLKRRQEAQRLKTFSL